VLNEAEKKLATFLAKERYRKNRERGVDDLKIGGQSCEFTDLQGIGAEIAFCKVHNIYPDMSLDDYPDEDALMKDGRLADVKCTKYENGHLLCVTWKKNRNVDIYVLVVGEFPRYRIAGFKCAGELFDDSNIKDFGYGPSYAVSQSELERFDDESS